MEELSTRSIQGMVKGISKYLFLCAWNYENLRDLLIKATDEIVATVNEHLRSAKSRRRTI